MRTIKGLLTLFLVSIWLATPGEGRAQDAETAVRTLLSEQENAWNDGDLDAFMEGYWKSDSLRFASGGEVRRGWRSTLDRYHHNYPDLDTMGKLTFTIYSVDILSDDRAFVFGRYVLQRKEDQPTGLFTLLVRRFEDNWRIVFDHTSADASANAE